MDEVTKEILREAHARVGFDNVDGNRGSPWFGGVYKVFLDIWKGRSEAIPPSRIVVFEFLRRSGLPFRTSGDYAEEYRTIYYNPTEDDKRLIARLVSKKLAIVESLESKDQIALFQ